jgi:hypothetical protein
LLVVVEGANDVRFLKRLSALLREADSTILDLQSLEQRGSLVFIPFGGGNVLAWSDRLAPLGCPEIHIYDRELPPETALREAAIDRINARPRCWAQLTRLPTAEHYLLPTLAAIRGTAGLTVPPIEIPTHVATSWYGQRGVLPAWDQLSARQRQRFIQRAKGWLFSHVLPRMTLDHLHAVDPLGEIAGWFAAMADLING